MFISRRAARRVSRRSLSTCIEAVECRRLLASVVGNQLVIDGTAGDDRIRVEAVGANLVVTTNNSPQSFAASGVSSILANLRAGHDRIDIIWNVLVPTTISGEAGNDTIIASQQADAIYTGSGNDAVYGGGGNDLIETSIGDDFVSPDAGNDTIDTGAGNDVVTYQDRNSAITAAIALSYRASPTNPAVLELFSTGKMMAGSETDTFNHAETLVGGNGNDTLHLVGTRLQGTSAVPRYVIKGGNGNDRLKLLQSTELNPNTLDPILPPDSFTNQTTSATRASGSTVRASAVKAVAPFIALTAEGGAGNDSITGSVGDDLIRPGLGNDTVDGGKGNDEVSYDDHTAPLDSTFTARHLRLGWSQYTWSTNATVTSSGEADAITSLEVLTGGKGNDILRLNVRDVYQTADGSQIFRINGAAGHDSLQVYSEWDTYPDEPAKLILDGNEGNDTFSGFAIYDAIGGNGDDLFIAQYGDDVVAPKIDAGAGIDELDLAGFNAGYYTMPDGLENLRVVGAHWGGGNVIVTGNDGPNTIYLPNARGLVMVDAKGGDDQIIVETTPPYSGMGITLLGGSGNDTIQGSGRNEWIDGGEGNDCISAGGGDDTILPGKGNDTVDAGAGSDEVSYADHTTAITGTIRAHVTSTRQWIEGSVQAINKLDTLIDAETLTGGSGNDALSLQLPTNFNYTVSTSMTVRLNGGDGNDSIGFGGVYGAMSYQGIAAVGDGGAGDDRFSYQYASWLLTLYGGDGNDTIGSSDDDIYAPEFHPGAGVDYFDYHGLSLTYTMPPGLENIRATGREIHIVGNDLPNQIEAFGQMRTYVDGSGGNDHIVRIAPPAMHSSTTLLGGEGNDTITGSDGADCIGGGAGDDSLSGLGGDDTILPGTGNDTIDAGEGRDEVSYAGRATPITGTLTGYRVATDQTGLYRSYGAGTVQAAGESDSFTNAEILTGGSGNDTLTVNHHGVFPFEISNEFSLRVNGGNGDDRIGIGGVYYGSAYVGFHTVADGGDGNDDFANSFAASLLTIIGGAGNDTISSSEDDVYTPVIQAGDGIDFYSFQGMSMDYTMPADLENIRASTSIGDIRIIGNDGANVIEVVGTRAVYVEGRGGNDHISFASATAFRGGPGTFIGNDGNDTILGSNGADLIDGGAGDDSLSGLGGDDTILPGTGNDTIDAGAGNDEASYANRTTAISGKLRANVTAQSHWFDGSVESGNELDTLLDVETLTGGSGNDSLELSMGSFNPWIPNTLLARLNGGDGNDGFRFAGIFTGEYAGIDAIADGGDGSDSFGYHYPASRLTLYGGAGDDTISSADDDVFAPNFYPGDGIDSYLFSGYFLHYTMPPGLENISATSNNGDIRIIGNDLPNNIAVSGSIGDYIDGRGGNDRIEHISRFGIHTLLGGDGNDTILGSDVNNQDSADSIDGGAGDDYLDGRGGVDSIYGGTGTDTAKRDDADAIVNSIEVLV